MEYFERLSQFVRRLRQYRTENEWASAVLDSASQFGQQIALFSIQDGYLRLRGHHGLNIQRSLALDIASAAAFQSAISSRDSVIALRTASEVGEALSSPDLSARAYIIPIENGPRVVALLFVAGQPVELNAIELIAGVASLALERDANRTLHTQITTQSDKNLGAEYQGQLL